MNRDLRSKPKTSGESPPSVDPNLMKILDELKTSIVSSISQQIDQIRVDVIELLESKFNTLNNKINSLETENGELKRRLAVLEESSHDFVDEMEERARRGCNLLVCGVEEEESGGKVQSISHDKRILGTILGKLDTTVTEANIKCVRLGKSGQSRPRPIKVFMNTREQALKILRRKREISGDFKNVMLYEDLTPTQMSHLKKLKQELAERRKKGESDIYIKYSRGKPAIQTKRTSKN